MTTTSPQPFPEGGVRRLSTKEQLQRAKALACTLPAERLPTCSGQVFVGLFFDGTGNNMRADYELPPPELRKHSNVVRLFLTYPPSTRRPGHFRFYVPGVGTPFPEIGDKGGQLGSGFAAGGEERVLWGFTRLVNAPHQYVFDDAPLISDADARTIAANVSSTGTPGAMRRVVFRTWQDKLKAALKDKKPRVEQINLSVFGFSRGAAQARAFVNWLFETCEPEGGGWTFAGIPIRLQFLGIFDTVASVGLANLYDNGVLSGHQSWADGNLEIHPAVEQCVHYVAGHEIRACFPLDSVRVKSKYPSNAMEVMYPGAHSDVGGGYAPNALGVSPSQESFLSIIPGVNMYHEARKSGVPLRPFDSLEPELQKSLTPSGTVIQDFNDYLRLAKLGSAPVEDMGRRHMSLYFSYRFKHLHSAQYYATPPYHNANSKDRGYLYKTQRTLFMQMAKLMDTVTAREPAYAASWSFLKLYGQIVDGARRSWDELSAAPSLWDKAWSTAWRSIAIGPIRLGTVVDNAEPAFVAVGKNPMQHAFEVAQSINVEAVTPEIQTFFDRYIHDSQAGFIDMGMDEYQRNGIGFVKFRTVFKGAD
ncbi:hypothetical protein CKO44_23545 [Rubrivivax gelatinosus]|uniref:T6SS phospholipase effector Tle1-like catalytic domain-containing protein n=1 Tax=Rubrivivax gelatinosus TaxID=28068 RepID=UPI0019037D6E|nr:DUF2235 domain-containing protein [Rubrivivax gelatinosus]MBK1616420.1 hypothetical protein [Rubrivivax gelatinosus]MBZ8142808.1 hypothetical protein [Rubrivivax gelatinosus]